MREVKVTGTKFQRPADFAIERHLGASFGVFWHHDGARKTQTVRIRFDAWAARLVSERLWLESQEIRALREGEIELRLELAGLEEIERWILSWGGHARVLSPKALRSRLAKAGREIAANHA